MKIKLPIHQNFTEDVIAKTGDTPFLEQLEFNIEQLNYRLSVLASIDVTVKENQSYFLMVCDSVLVIIRAVLLEKGQKNYTIQRYLKTFGLERQLSDLEAYLASNFSIYNKSIKDVLKFITDKFICHVDNTDFMEIGNANFIMSTFMNPYVDCNLQSIINKINTIINKTY